MIYDITQELLHGAVYPGDRAPECKRIRSFETGGNATLSELTINVHNATHIDAPIHMVPGGKSIDELDLDACMGMCEVIQFADLERLKQTAAERVLLAGCESMDEEIARLLVEKKIRLVGVEGQSVGTHEVHQILLRAGTVILEGVRLGEVPAGTYLLSALPIKIGGCDGAPCRAVLADLPFPNYSNSH